MLKTSMATLMFATLVAIAASAQTSEDTSALKAELGQIHSQWYAAFDKGDGAPMDKIEVPNFAYVNPDGKGSIFRKSKPRAGTVKPQAAVVSRTLHDSEVRRFGDTAILTGILTTKLQSGREDEIATTVVWVRQNGRWLIASAQASQVIR